MGRQGESAVSGNSGFSVGEVCVDVMYQSRGREAGEQCAGRDPELFFAQGEFEEALGGNVQGGTWRSGELIWNRRRNWVC